MKNVLRLAVTIISALATFYFTFWVGGALLSAVGLPFPFWLVLAVFAAAAVTYFTPGANQGPLLGIFYTGPIGFVLGAVGGAVHWIVRK